MTVWEATSFKQWICSVSVGDIINLFFALGTVSMAVLTFILLKRQTHILESEVNDKDVKFKRKAESALSSLQFAMLFGEGKLADEDMEFVERERHNITRLFCAESDKAINDLLNTYYEYCDFLHGPDMSPDELNEVIQDFRKKAAKSPLISADSVSHLAISFK